MLRLRSADRHPNILVKKWYGLVFGLRRALTREIQIIDGGLRYRFSCDNLRQYSRCVKMFVKEPGTAAWISRDMKTGDVFFDIGANIGVYTILAACRVGNSGKVYAFEPHSGNFSKLLDNILINGMQQVVVPCNVALHEEDGFLRFDYRSIQAGQSNSQLSYGRDGSPAVFGAEISELKYAASVDSLIGSGKVEKPQHVKIDVDGNELPILRGMTRLLASPEPPRSVQVEIDTEREAEIGSFLEAHKYVLTNKHYTRSVMKRKAKTMHLKSHHYNAIFRPAGTN